jgi:exosortase
MLSRMSTKVRLVPGYPVFGLLIVLSTAILWRPFIATLTLALRDDQYTHILLVLPISAALIFSEWSSIPSSFFVKTGIWVYPSLAVVLAASSRWWSARQGVDVQLTAGMLALLTLWVATFVICFGAQAARSLLFPLCFLFWMVPIPSFLLARIVHWLQSGSAVATCVLFSGAGVPASRDGVLVSIPGLTVQVASECSSIRSSLMLLVTTMVLSHVLLKAPWRKVLLVLVAIPLSVAKNGLRIFTLAMLGTRVDRSFLTGRLHHDGGIVFFMFALAAIAMLLWFLRRNEEGAAFVPRLSPASS